LGHFRTRFRRRRPYAFCSYPFDAKESKMADKPIQGTQRPADGQQPLEERGGIVSEVLVPLAGAGLTGAADAAVTHLLKKKDK
jgi:hypothetical protein